MMSKIIELFVSPDSYQHLSLVSAIPDTSMKLITVFTIFVKTCLLFSSTHYTGGYNFKLDIGKQTKDTKATAWTVSYYG